jgi:hypothetical protein
VFFFFQKILERNFKMTENIKAAVINLGERSPKRGILDALKIGEGIKVDTL